MGELEIVTTYVKLANYLTKNQLIQANAMTQRMENLLKDEFGENDPATHPLCGVLRITKKIQQQIVLGNTEKALIMATEEMRTELQKTQDLDITIREVRQSLGD